MLKNIKHMLKEKLPVKGIEPPCINGNVKKFVTLSLQRSGQHAVINWICSQKKDVIHFNHCNFERKHLSNWITPINNRVIHYDSNDKIDSDIQSYDEMVDFLSRIERCKHLLYSFEDVDIENKILQKYILKTKPIVIIILRDPYNWLASTLKHREFGFKQLVNKKKILIKYMKQALYLNDYLGCPTVTINYNKWVTDKTYRKDICLALDIPFSASADKSILEVPDFGGGSSFEGTKPIKECYNNSVFDRWKDFTSDPVYRELLNDPHLIDLSKSFFATDSPF